MNDDAEKERNRTMAHKTTTPTPATETGTEADKGTSNTALRNGATSNEELDNVSGGINPQPLPPRKGRMGGEPPVVVD